MKKILQGIKKRWTDYLDRLGAVNQKLYGNQRLNCCDMKNKIEGYHPKQN